MFTIRLLFVLLVAVFFSTTPAFAQRQFGAIEGTVTEMEGSPIPGVTITASSPSLIGTTAVAYTDSGGHYRYRLAQSRHLRSQSRIAGIPNHYQERDSFIYVGNTATVNFNIQAETVSETITVLGAPPLIDSATTATSNTVPPEIVQNLPKASSVFWEVK